MNPDFRRKIFWLGNIFLVPPLLVLCVLYVDIPVALYVKHYLYGNRNWSRFTSDIPDLLLVVVLLVTFTAFAVYVVRSRKGIYDNWTLLTKIITWAAPASFLSKTVLKFVFGRVNTRHWLHNPNLYSFQWFDGGTGFQGFPSGHMLVIVTLFAALCRFFPRSRAVSIIVATLLGLSLIATNYHFVSDVIAGAYLGVIIEALLFRMLLREPGGVRFPAI